jgi:hypothetical protein
MCHCFTSAHTLLGKVENHLSEGCPELAIHHLADIASSASLMGLLLVMSAAEAARTAVVDRETTETISGLLNKLRAALASAEDEWSIVDVDPAQTCRSFLLVQAPPPPAAGPAVGAGGRIAAMVMRQSQMDPDAEEGTSAREGQSDASAI